VENPNTPGGVVGAKTLEEFRRVAREAAQDRHPRASRQGTDAVIDSLVPLLEKDDIVIDGGNALWTDTIRREKSAPRKRPALHRLGVSGGEEGARFGPALMPGGDRAAYKELEPIWNAVAAKVDPKTGAQLGAARSGQAHRRWRAVALPTSAKTAPATT